MDDILEGVARPEHPGAIREEFDRLLARATESSWPQLEVMFGWAWGEWDTETLSPEDLSARVKTLEGADEGSLGADDVYVRIEELGLQIKFCHEGDLHLEGDPDSATLRAELERYRELGWSVSERTQKKTQPDSEGPNAPD